MLNSELLEKKRLVGQNVTEETKIALEAKAVELEQKLKDSEDKIQMQLEKMKKIAANLKKKSAVCQELETRVTELEEKWTTEKDEKEAKNKQIQDVEISMREKDNQIADLEKKLIQARNESAEAFANIDKLTSDLSNSKEKMSLMAQQITEMEKEIVKLRVDLSASASELAAERNVKQDITLEYEGYKEQIAKENENKQVELDEVKEKARELSVRMQVMEAEYVEQLGLIKNLIAENALLSSKQTQISEKLENVEKESEQRKVLIEQMQRAAVSSATATTQTVDEEAVEEDAKISDSQHCNHCEQCQTVVQALEAKLHEREAEIENLDNELANSIDNFVQLQESLRYNDMMNQAAMWNRSLEDPYNDLLLQYNALVSSNEEIKAILDRTLKQNKDLADAVEGLQAAKTSLEVKIMATEETKSNEEKLQNIDSLNSDLQRKYEESEKKLLNVQKEMQTVRQRADIMEQELNSQAALLFSEWDQRTQTEAQMEEMRDNFEGDIWSVNAAKDACEKKIQNLKIKLKAYQNKSERFTEKSVVHKDSQTFDFPTNEVDDTPQLFDASKIFGAASSFGPSPLDDSELLKLQALLNEKEAQCLNLTQEINDLQKQMIEERETSRKELHVAQTNHERAEQFLTESKREIVSLNDELQNYMLQIRQAMGSIEKLSSERDQQNASLESYKLRMADLEGQLGNSTDPELIQDLEARISNITKERDLLQLQMSDLSRSLEELKRSNETSS